MSRFHRMPARAYARIRRAALDAAGWRCERCGRSGRLQVHHRKPLYRGGRHELDNCVVLCGRCHLAEHRRQPPSPGLPSPERPGPRPRHPRGGREWREAVDELRREGRVKGS